MLCPARKLLHDQEVRGKPLAADDVVLVLKALHDLVGQWVAIALLEAGDGLFAQHGLVCLSGRQRETRQDDLAKLQGDVAFIRDLERGGKAFRMLLERLCHLLGALHVKLVV